MNVEPPLANNLRRLITESSLKLATARSACPRSYLHCQHQTQHMHCQGLHTMFLKINNQNLNVKQRKQRNIYVSTYLLVFFKAFAYRGIFHTNVVYECGCVCV